MSQSVSCWLSHECVEVQDDDVEHENIPLMERRNDHDDLSPQENSLPVYSSITADEYYSKTHVQHGFSLNRDFEDEMNGLFERRRNCDIQNLNTQLLEAVSTCQVGEIRKCVQQGASPNATCRLNKVSACHIAATNINADCLYVLLKMGAEGIRSDGFRRTSLYMAAWAGNAKNIAMLLKWPEDIQNKITSKVSEKTVNEIRELGTSVDLINSSSSDYSDPLIPDEWKDDIIHNCRKIEQNLPEPSIGWTPLHAACLRAQFACVQVLLAAGANPCKPDFERRTPLDITGHAHYSGYTIDVRDFRRTIQVLLDSGVRFGYETSPQQLHIAVALGCEETIKNLLNAGFPVRTLDSNGLTAMHICVKKQNGSFLHLLANFDPEQSSSTRENDYRYPERKIINTKDNNGLTVLHAAVQDKWIYGVLIALQCGANISMKTNNGDLPLHIAAAAGAIKIMKFLIKEARFNTNTIDICDRDGYTALFIAIKNNNLEAVKMLLQNGASLRITKDRRLSGLHVAARHGRVEIMEFLFNDFGEYVDSLVNDIGQVDRYTPIVYAVVNNHPECVSLLLKKGAQIDMLVPCVDDIYESGIWTTPCHIAASKNYIHILKLLIDFDKTIIHKRNSAGFLPIHEASLKSNTEIMSVLIQNGADLAADHPIVMTPMRVLLRNLIKPEVYLESVFDSYIIGKGLDDRKFDITVDYRMLLTYSLDGNQMRVVKSLSQTSAAYNPTELLQHPLIESFLYLKWKAFSPYFYVILAIYIWFLFSLNIFIVSVFFYNDNNRLNTTNATSPIVIEYTPAHKILVSDFWKYMIYISSICVVFLESIFFKDLKYLYSLETIVKYCAIGFSWFLPIYDMQSMTATESELMRFVATLAILLSWLEMMFLLSRFPKWGFYVLILVQVTVKVLKVMLTSIFLIIGFAFGFMIQFRAKEPFEDPWAAITKTFVMMTSEFDYSSTVNNSDSTIMAIQRLIFLIFVIFGSVVLMNLMVSVAVNDVTQLESIGMRKRLQKQVDFLTSFEDIVVYGYVQRIIRKCVPKRCKAVFSRKINVPGCITIRTADANCTYNKILPKHIKEALVEKICLKRKQQKDEIDSSEQKNKLDKIQDDIEKLDERVDKIIKEIENTDISKLKKETYDDNISLSS